MRIKNEYRETTIISKSRFITCVYTTRTEEEARNYINLIRKDFSDATHVCTAYSIGNNIKRSSDNGEPSGTAGIPILESINSQDIEDICVCVVRYFGGIKLGAGGLIRAYSNCTTNAIKNAPKTIDEVYKQYKIIYSYEFTGPIETYLRKNCFIDSQKYDDKITTIVVSKNDIVDDINNISKGSAIITFEKDVIKEVDAD